MRKPPLFRALAGLLTLNPSSRLPRRLPFSTMVPSPGGRGVAVKKVTRSNFEATLEELRASVRESDFVAVDLEMTGVTSAPWREAFEFDRSDVRYLKVKDSAEKFAVVQFGVCPFRWDSSKQLFVAHPHNFYIFPRKELPIDGPSHEFLCQTTSMDFLAKFQFDFNACVYEGISYLSREQEAEALRSLSSAYEDRLADFLHNSSESVEIPLVSTADVLFTERLKIRFHEWRNGLLKYPGACHPLDGGTDDPKPYFQTTFFKMRPAVELTGFSSHQHKLIQLVIRKHFKDLVYVRASGGNISGERKVVYADSVDDRALLMKEVQDDLWNQVRTKIGSAIGFRHVIDLLASEQKLVVGHNCFLDIAHIYNKFVGPLPSSITEFASSVHKIFPHIADTKHLLKVDHVTRQLMKKNSTALSSAFALLCPQISSVSHNSCSNSHSYVKVEVQVDETGSNSGAKHEAGYDAFMTGCVFAQACSHLGIDFKLQSTSLELVSNSKLQKHINLLYPSWRSGTVIDLRTGIENPESGVQTCRRRYPKIVFDNIVIFWGFPSKFKPKDLRECICKVFGPDSLTSIFYLDSTAALIQFSKQELATDFLLLKDTLERNDDPISVLHPLSKLLEIGSTRAAKYDIYKHICSSSLSRVLFADQAEAVGIRLKTRVEPREEGIQELASGSESTEVVEIKDFACGRERTESAENPDSMSFVNHVKGKKSDGGRESHYGFSCEELLDSVCASKSLYGRTMM